MQKLKNECGMIGIKNAISLEQTGIKIMTLFLNMICKLPLVISRRAFDLFCSNSGQLMLEMLITTISIYFTTVL